MRTTIKVCLLFHKCVNSVKPAGIDGHFPVCLPSAAPWAIGLGPFDFENRMRLHGLGERIGRFRFEDPTARLRCPRRPARRQMSRNGEARSGGNWRFVRWSGRTCPGQRSGGKTSIRQPDHSPQKPGRFTPRSGRASGENGIGQGRRRRLVGHFQTVAGLRRLGKGHRSARCLVCRRAGE